MTDVVPEMVDMTKLEKEIGAAAYAPPSVRSAALQDRRADDAKMNRAGNTLSHQIEEFESIPERIEKAEERVRAVLDRITGARPRLNELEGKKLPTAERISIFGSMRAVHDRGVRALDALERVLVSLEESV